ncbi:MAG TPA: response regulator transcription factor [Solirubrobacteraceae bacterium]|jgi:DNA-binding NarL/FixJ family response regulator
MSAGGSSHDSSAAESSLERAPAPVRVVLADDQRLVRESVGTLLGLLDGIELLATADDGEQAIALCAQHRPQVVLMDLRMPRLDGIAATRRLRDEQPDVRVIALTTYADDDSVLGALRAGARGYLTKDASGADIRNAILTVAGGDAALDPAVQHHVVAALAAARATPTDASAAAAAAPALPDDLTPREAQVLALIAAGLTNAEIAERLVVSPTTVKSHINHLFAKARLRDRAQAVAYAYRTGIAAPPE